MAMESIQVSESAAVDRRGELIGIGYSPWTEKARWALDHHGIDYRYSEHLILFGMLPLRIKLGKLSRRQAMVKRPKILLQPLAAASLRNDDDIVIG